MLLIKDIEKGVAGNSEVFVDETVTTTSASVTHPRYQYMGGSQKHQLLGFHQINKV